MIVDSSALFAILFNEPDHEHFVQKLALRQGSLTMSVATNVEAHIVAQRSRLTGVEDALTQLIDDHNIQMVSVTPELGKIAIEAHRIYGKGSGHPARLNFGDCFSYALAKERGEPLLFKGNDFAATDIEAVG